MVFNEDLDLVSSETIKLRDEELAFAHFTFKLDPVFEVLMKVDDSNGCVTTKKHDHIVGLLKFEFSQVIVTVHKNFVDLTQSDRMLAEKTDEIKIKLW